MKKIITLLLLIAPLSQAWTQNLKTVIKYSSYSYTPNDIAERYTILNAPPYYKHGTYESFLPGGDILTKLNYNKGELDGIQYYYLKSDYLGSSSESCIGLRKPMSEYTYKNGKKIGWQKEYECNSWNSKNVYFLKEETFLGDNYQYNLYYPNGIKAIEEHYNRISGDGKEIHSYESGEINMTIEYKKKNDTIYAGSYKKYYKSQLYEEGTFEGCLYCWIKYTGSQLYGVDLRTFETNRCDLSIVKTIKNGKKDQFCHSKYKEVECPCYLNGQRKKSGDTTFYESGKIKSRGNELEYYESGSLKRSGDSLYFENNIMQTDGKNTWFTNGNPNKKVLSDRTEYYYESGKIKQMVESDSLKKIEYLENGNISLCWDKVTVNNKQCEITRTYYENGNIRELTYQDQSGTQKYSSEEDFEKTQIRNQLQSAYQEFTQTVLNELTTSLEMKGAIDFSRTEQGKISFSLSVTSQDKSSDPSITDKLSSCISKTTTNTSVVLPVYNKAYSFKEQISIQVVYGKEKVFVKSGKSLLSYGETDTESNKPKKVNTVCKNEIAREKIINDYTSQKAGVYKINYRTITTNDNPSQTYLTQEKYKIHTIGGNILRYTGYTIVLGVSLLLALGAQ